MMAYVSELTAKMGAWDKARVEHERTRWELREAEHDLLMAMIEDRAIEFLKIDRARLMHAIRISKG